MEKMMDNWKDKQLELFDKEFYVKEFVRRLALSICEMAKEWRKDETLAG